MKTMEIIKDVFSELFHHKLRTLLTLLGMIFGVGAVIAMLSIGEGAEREAMQLIDSMGLRNIIVNSKEMDEQQLKEVREKTVGLSLRDLEVLEATFPFIEASGAEKTIKTYALFSNQSKSDATVKGRTPSYFALSNSQVASGRLLNQKDERAYSQVVVLGEQAAKQLFPSSEPVGEYLKINHLWFEVVGVIADRKLSKDEIGGIKLGGESNQVFVPLNTALKKFKFGILENEVDTLKVQVKKGTDIYQASQGITKVLSKRHAEIDDFSLIIPSALLEQQNQTQRIFTIVMSCVAGISLLVGGIGIMNIMLATVLERTKEIGLFRAVGARKTDIVIQFVIESFVIAALGGVLGIALGFALAFVIASYANWAVASSLFAVVLAVGVCAVIGVGFGLYPAIKASKLDPIEALQRD
ncbi:ABC transporter permease [Pleionea sediminis]|uniref:ABC transporter permease n=1 Tax=Pleionea sediminis TaxID=2569479 RepID=UPI001186F0B2|nr:ABC transporter permease [Pleionea sediminis]